MLGKFRFCNCVLRCLRCCLRTRRKEQEKRKKRSNVWCLELGGRLYKQPFRSGCIIAGNDVLLSRNASCLLTIDLHLMRVKGQSVILCVSPRVVKARTSNEHVVRSSLSTCLRQDTLAGWVALVLLIYHRISNGLQMRLESLVPKPVNTPCPFSFCWLLVPSTNHFREDSLHAISPSFLWTCRQTPAPSENLFGAESASVELLKQLTSKTCLKK